MMTDITREEIAAYKTWIDSGKKTPVAGLARLNTIKKLNAFESALCNLALQALDARGGWRPISEAPKDETSILVNFKLAESGPPDMTVMFWGESNSGKEGWFDPLGSPLNLDKDDLDGAHWMPLPSPPTQAKEPSDD